MKKSESVWYSIQENDRKLFDIFGPIVGAKSIDEQNGQIVAFKHAGINIQGGDHLCDEFSKEQLEQEFEKMGYTLQKGLFKIVENQNRILQEIPTFTGSVSITGLFKVNIGARYLGKDIAFSIGFESLRDKFGCTHKNQMEQCVETYFEQIKQIILQKIESLDWEERQSIGENGPRLVSLL